MLHSFMKGIICKAIFGHTVCDNSANTEVVGLPTKTQGLTQSLPIPHAAEILDETCTLS